MAILQPAKPSIDFGKMTEPLIHLSEADVARLLSNNTAEDARVDISERIASNYSKDTFNPSEAVIAEQIFRLLVKDTEVRLRKALSEALKFSMRLPRDIANIMARDAVDDVALPMLQFSKVLQDDELIDIIKKTALLSRHVAVSKREVVSERLSESLLEDAPPAVIQSLVENEGAVISEHALSALIELRGDEKKLMDMLGARRELPPSIVEKLIHHVSDNLATALRNKYQVNAEDITREASYTRELATLQLIDNNITMEELDKMVTQLYTFGRLSPSLIFAALCRGQLAFFILSVAKLAGVPPENAQTLINDRGDLGFRAVYNKSGLPESMYHETRLLLNVVQTLLAQNVTPGTPSYVNGAMELLIETAHEQGIDDISHILAVVKSSV